MPEDRDALVKKAVEAVEELIPWSPGTESRRGFPSPKEIVDAVFSILPTTSAGDGELVERLSHQISAVTAVHRKGEIPVQGDAVGFAAYCRDLDAAKVALANHVLDQWGPILEALRAAARVKELEEALTKARCRFVSLSATAVLEDRPALEAKIDEFVADIDAALNPSPTEQEITP